MQLVHETITGAHLLHWLTVAGPLATLLVVSGAVGRRGAARLLLLGIVMTLATAAIASVDPTASRLRYGAPLAVAYVDLDPRTAQIDAGVTMLRACVVANLVFWCSGAILLGALIRSGSTRLRDRRCLAPR